jgi:hypothetical protein
VLGTLMMDMLAGHRRYAHITALRGDAVAAQALGMNKVVSEDALRRALERIDEAASTAWMRPALMHSVREALDSQTSRDLLLLLAALTTWHPYSWPFSWYRSQVEVEKKSVTFTPASTAAEPSLWRNATVLYQVK